jgi:hypothetical protein
MKISLQHLVATIFSITIFTLSTAYMQPITNQRNIEAAKRAAHKRSTQSTPHGIILTSNRRSKAISRLLRRYHQTLDKIKSVIEKLKRQLDKCLNGNRPYGFTCRFTGVNLLVVCSFWFLFIDQLRLVYAPTSWDYEFAVVSL